jgi:hypothetical protein
MKVFLKVLVLFVLAMLLSTCSSSKMAKKSEKYVVSDTNLYAWVNLMPGGKPKFHISGDLNLIKTGDISPDSVDLREVTVLQNSNMFYRFTPIIDDKMKRQDENISSEILHIHFTDGKGFVIEPEFNMDQPVIVQFHFFYGRESYIYNSKDIKVEKVY